MHQIKVTPPHVVYQNDIENQYVPVGVEDKKGFSLISFVLGALAGWIVASAVLCAAFDIQTWPRLP